PILHRRPVHLRLSAEQHAAQLCPRVFEREIDVPRTLNAQIGNLPRHPDLAYLRFQQPPYLPRQFRNRQNFPGQRRSLSRLTRLCRKQLPKIPLRFNRLTHLLNSDPLPLPLKWGEGLGEGHPFSNGPFNSHPSPLTVWTLDFKL